MDEPGEADVYVDVILEDGLLFFVICNDGELPATRVRVTFDRPVIGMDGLDVTGVGAFSHLEFLAPGRRIRVLIDRSHAYFSRRQRSAITMKLAWRAGGASMSSSLTHDMRVYADLPTVHRRLDPNRTHPTPS